MPPPIVLPISSHNIFRNLAISPARTRVQDALRVPEPINSNRPNRFKLPKINKKTAHAFNIVSGFLIVIIIAATHPLACKNTDLL
jgi:hypothetical protein